MPVTERLAAPGSWSLRLDDPPDRVRNQFDLFDSIVIMAAWTPPGVTRSELLKRCIYRGPILVPEAEGRLLLEGQGMAAYLGDGGGIGPGEVRQNLSAKTFSSWMAQFVTDGEMNGVNESGTSSATTWPDSGTSGELPYNTLDAIKKLAEVLEVDWYVETTAGSPNGAIFYDDAGSLGVTDPQVLITREARSQKAAVEVLEAHEWHVDVDGTGYLNYVRVGDTYAGATYTGVSDALAGEQIKDAAGSNALKRRREISDSSVSTNAEAATWATGVRQANDEPKTRITCAVECYAPPMLLTPGDTVAVWDIEDNIYDNANTSVAVGGQMLHPKHLKLHALSWHITAGMGVYLLPSDSSDAIVDLTPWVQFEDGLTSLELGAATHTAFDP